MKTHGEWQVAAIEVSGDLGVPGGAAVVLDDVSKPSALCENADRYCASAESVNAIYFVSALPILRPMPTFPVELPAPEQCRIFLKLSSQWRKGAGLSFTCEHISATP